MEILKQFLIEAGNWDPDEFTRVWNESSSVKEVAERFGMSTAHAAVRASQLRKLGYELKKFPRGGRKGSKMMPKDVIKTKLPSKSKFIEMWNEVRSVSGLATKLGLTPYVVKKILDNLKKAGEKLAPGQQKGPPKKIDLSTTVIVKIWDESSDLSEVVEKVKELGVDVPDEKLRRYITWRVHKINRVRRAMGKPDLKKLDRSTLYKLKAEDEPGDEGFYAEDMPSSLPDEDVAPPPEEPPPEEDPWDDKTDPGAPSFDEVEQEIAGKESSEFLEEPEQESANDEFAKIWNEAESMRDAYRKLKRAGWSLSKKDVIPKVKELRSAGFKLKKFI